MAKGPTREQISRLRWLSITALAALFVSDYGFAIFAKEVPGLVYMGLVAIAIGVDMGTMRGLFVAFLKSWVRADDGNNPKT